MTNDWATMRGLALVLFLFFSAVASDRASAIPPERRMRTAPSACRRLLLTATTLTAVGVGVVWSTFHSPPSEPIEKALVSGGSAAEPFSPDARAAADRWGEALGSGQSIEATIPRAASGLQTARLFHKSSSHRFLADLARANLAKARPDLSLGKGPGIEIPLDRLILRQEEGELVLVFKSPLGELKSQSPLPRDALLSGSSVTVSMAPMVIPGDAGEAKVEAALRIRLAPDWNLLLVEDAVIRVRVSAAQLLVDTVDETKVPPLSATCELRSGSQ